MSTDLVPAQTFELDQRRATAYAQSGYWPDASDVAKALVKIEAGRSLGLPPIVAMSEVHVIDGKPTLGAGALSALVKASGRYDYRVDDLTDQRCVLLFYEKPTGELLGESVFTISDAERAKLTNKGPWSMYPRNMLFARAMSNGVAWYCPDVTAGRIYTPDELGQPLEPTGLVEEADEIDWPETDASERYEHEQQAITTQPAGDDPEPAD